MKSGSWASWNAALPPEAYPGGEQDDDPRDLEGAVDPCEDEHSPSERDEDYRSFVCHSTDRPCGGSIVRCVVCGWWLVNCACGSSCDVVRTPDEGR